MAAGASAFNHFWGGVASITVLGIDILLLSTVYYSNREAGFRHHGILWLSHFVGLLPAGVLYGWYKLNGLGGHYNKYIIFNSWEWLLTSAWYAK